MKWQGKIGFVMFLLVIFEGMALIQREAKAQGNIGRQQAVEIVADYIQPSRNPYIKIDEVQEKNDDFNVEVVTEAEDTPVSEVIVDKPTSWMGPAMMANMSRMMGRRMRMMGPMGTSTRWDTVPRSLSAVRAETGSAQMAPMVMDSGMHWPDGKKSPSAAALLSLQPTPVALGNFYADDWEKGILYTTLEVGMFIPGMILLSDQHLDHFHNGYTGKSWTDTERRWFISLVTGYVVLKVISAFDAAYSAERYIRRDERASLEVSPKMDSWTLKTRVSF